MKKSRFSQAQMVGIPKEHGAGVPAQDLCGKRGIGDAGSTNWRARAGGMAVADPRPLKAPGAGSAKPKKMPVTCCRLTPGPSTPGAQALRLG